MSVTRTHSMQLSSHQAVVRPDTFSARFSVNEGEIEGVKELRLSIPIILSQSDKVIEQAKMRES